MFYNGDAMQLVISFHSTSNIILCVSLFLFTEL